MRFSRLIPLFAAASLVTGCFTGIESTPPITNKELKRQHVADTPERHVLDGIEASEPKSWKPGRRFYVADSRASRAAWRVEPPSLADSIEGRVIVLSVIDTVTTLTDSLEIQLTFSVDVENNTLSSPSLIFRTGMTPGQWQEAASFTLPHTIDMEVVDKASQKLSGNTYYYLQRRRQGFDGHDTLALRYQPVRVVDVRPATEATPLCVVFADSEGHLASVNMTYGDTPTSRRNFDTLFAIDNPRVKYKNITETTWQNIISGRVATGMTPLECRLALGSPDNYTRVPSTAGMVEHWMFNGGVYLRFEDGVLVYFRQ